MDFLKACHLLLEEAQDDGRPATFFAALSRVNTLRAEANIHLTSSLSAFNPPLPDDVFNPTRYKAEHRVYWQSGLTQLIKGQRLGGLKQMAVALHAIDDRVSQALLQLLSSDVTLDDAVAYQLFQRYDALFMTEAASNALLAEMLWIDTQFYLDASSLREPTYPSSLRDPKGRSNLNKIASRASHARNAYFAKQCTQLLFPTTNEVKIEKSLIIQHITPLTDGLLFMGEVTLRERLLQRLNKIDDHMLKIAVPIQKLMGECMRLSV